MRLDQWLWAVRIYKTRPLSVDAIKGGHVKLNDQPTKPAREVHPGEIISAQIGAVRRVFRVIGNPPSRVSASLVPQFAEDLTPPEEYQKAKMSNVGLPPQRPKGAGRPTKRERRILDRLDP